jgi:hypothetical protein
MSDRNDMSDRNNMSDRNDMSDQNDIADQNTQQTILYGNSIWTRSVSVNFGNNLIVTPYIIQLSSSVFYDLQNNVLTGSNRRIIQQESGLAITKNALILPDNSVLIFVSRPTNSFYVYIIPDGTIFFPDGSVLSSGLSQRYSNAGIISWYAVDGTTFDCLITTLLRPNGWQINLNIGDVISPDGIIYQFSNGVSHYQSMIQGFKLPQLRGLPGGLQRSEDIFRFGTAEFMYDRDGSIFFPLGRVRRIRSKYNAMSFDESSHPVSVPYINGIVRRATPEARIILDIFVLIEYFVAGQQRFVLFDSMSRSFYIRDNFNTYEFYAGGGYALISGGVYRPSKNLEIWATGTLSLANGAATANLNNGEIQAGGQVFKC